MVLQSGALDLAVALRGRPQLVLGSRGGVQSPTDGWLWPGAYLGGRAHGYLLQLADGDLALQLGWQLGELRRLRSWNSTARFLVVLTGTRPGRREVRAVFSAMHSVFVDNVVLVVSSGGGSADLYTMFPYRDQSTVCGKGSLGVTLVARWRAEPGVDSAGRSRGGSAGHLQLLAERGLFPAGRAERLPGGCRLRVVINNLTNKDNLARKLAVETVRLLHAEPEVSVSRSRLTDVKPSGEWTGLLGYLQRDEADLAVLLIPTLVRSRVGCKDACVS